MPKGKEPFLGYAFSVRKPGESVREINASMTDEARRRRETRRAIEDLEEALRLRREDDALREGDW